MERAGNRRWLLLLAVLLAGCGGRKEEAVPDSPVGRFEMTAYRDVRPEGADAIARPQAKPIRTVRIEVRADHTLRYEWKDLEGQGKKDGSLEATWREPTKEEAERVRETGRTWFVFKKGEPGRRRDLTDGEMKIRWGTGGQWLLPVVDIATGDFTDAFWPLERSE